MSHQHLFVYGTLLPGDVRWPMLAPFVVDGGWPDEVPGRLFDTGLGYPAAIFEPRREVAGGPIIRGRTFSLLATSAARCLEVLDIEEDTVDGLYRRVTVLTGRGVDAWAYSYGSGLELQPIPSGNWFDRRNRPDTPTA